MKSLPPIPVSQPPALGDQALYIDHYLGLPHGVYHFHATCELVFTQGSSGERIIGDDVSPIRPAGDLLMVGPHLPHTWSPDRQSSGRLPMENIVVHFTRESLGLELLARPELAVVRRLLHEAEQGVEFAPAALAQVRTALRELPGLDGAGRLFSFLQILHRLAALGWSRRLATASHPGSPQERDHQAFAKVVQYVQAHQHDPIALDAVAAQVGMSRTTFSRFFRRVCKTSFIAWLNDWRIQRAALRLRETDLSVLDIALKSGYRNLSHFNRQFRQITGTTPTAWRRQQD